MLAARPKFSTTTLLIPFLFFLACQPKPKGKLSDHYIEEARFHMQNNNWDSARIYAVHVLAEAKERKDISLANTIISLANDNLKIDDQERVEKHKRLLASMKKRLDLIEGINWYYDPMTIIYTNKNSFHLYIGKKADECWLRFRLQYVGEEPLSILGFSVFTDNMEYTFPPDAEVQYGGNTAGYWEWFDQKYNADLHDMMLDVIDSQRAELVLIGLNGNVKRLISTKEKIALRRVLQAYELNPSFKGYSN